jgi:hypothetical protein
VAVGATVVSTIGMSSSPSPRGIITVKGSFELSDRCDKEFHKMAQNFGMVANYREPKDKIASMTTGITKQLSGPKGSCREDLRNIDNKRNG